MESLHDIPHDVILNEILTRTSHDTLARCRVVCKRWKEDAYQSSFTKLFLQRTKTISGFFIQSMKRNGHSSTFISMHGRTNSNISLSFLPRQIKIKASTKQGLLLCKYENPTKPRIPQYIICKPTTQQWRKIPNPKTRYFTRKTAIVVVGSNPFQFKIVRFSEPKRHCITYKSTLVNILRCEIFDSKTWSWKCLSENIMFPFSETLDFNPCMVSTLRILHSLTTRKRIFAFDLEKKSWEIFALPCSLRDDGYCKYYDMQLVEYGGRLGLICMFREEEYMELWVVEDYFGQRIWTKRNQVSLERLMREEKYIFPEAFCNNDVAIMKNAFKIIFYNFQTSTWEMAKLENFTYGRVGIFPMESDCEPLELLDVSSRRLSTKSSGGWSLISSCLRVLFPLLFIFLFLLIVLRL